MGYFLLQNMVTLHNAQGNYKIRYSRNPVMCSKVEQLKPNLPHQSLEMFLHLYCDTSKQVGTYVMWPINV